MRAANALARRSLLARPVRTVLTVIGIALGTGVLVAGLILNAALDAAVERSVTDIVGRADVRVAAFEEQGLSPESVAAVATTPGVATVAPSLERRTYPLASGALATLPAPVTVVGIARAADPAVHDRPLSAGAPLGFGEKLLAAYFQAVTPRTAGFNTISIGDMTAPALFLIAWSGSSFGAGLFLGPAIQADVIDYDEFHTGRRREAHSRSRKGAHPRLPP